MIELLVVVSLIGFLLALIIPAVQSAREAARRAACINNLKQFGVALGGHAGRTGHFPPAQSPGGFSPHAILLNYFGENSLYNSINFKGDVDSPENETSCEMSINYFLCPSDDFSSANARGRKSWVSYAGNRGVGVQKYGYNGLFGPIDPISVGAVTDGLSNTAAIAEWLTGGTRSDDPRRPTFATPDVRSSPGQFDEFAENCRTLKIDSAAAILPGKGSRWIQGEFSYTLYNHTLPPNNHTCTNGGRVQIGAWTTGSLHPGGANVLYADGSVDFVRDTIALEVWRALGSRAGGEVAGHSSY